MKRLSDTTFLNPFFLEVKMRCITSMGIKIFTIDVAGQCEQSAARRLPDGKQLSARTRMWMSVTKFVGDLFRIKAILIFSIYISSSQARCSFINPSRSLDSFTTLLNFHSEILLGLKQIVLFSNYSSLKL